MSPARVAVQLGLSLIGKFASSMAISGIYVYSLEMFPTDSRHGLLAICCLSGRLGLLLAPYSPLLVSFKTTSSALEYVPHPTNVPATYPPLYSQLRVNAFANRENVRVNANFTTIRHVLAVEPTMPIVD